RNDSLRDERQWVRRNSDESSLQRTADLFGEYRATCTRLFRDCGAIGHGHAHVPDEPVDRAAESSGGGSRRRRAEGFLPAVWSVRRRAEYLDRLHRKYLEPVHWQYLWQSDRAQRAAGSDGV